MASLGSLLAQYAYGNETRIEQLSQWRDEAILSVASGQGKDVVQTSANGVSVAFAAGKTVESWLQSLSEALVILNTGTLPNKKKQATFPCDC